MATRNRQNGRRRQFFRTRQLSSPQLQFYMLLLQNPGSGCELSSVRGEHRFGIRHSVRLQHLKRLVQLRSYVTQTEFTVEFKNRVEIRERKAGARELVQLRA